MYFLPSYKVKLDVGAHLMLMNRTICRITGVYQKEINKPNNCGEDDFQIVWMFKYFNLDTKEEGEMEGWVAQLQGRMKAYKYHWQYWIARKIGGIRHRRTLRQLDKIGVPIVKNR